MILWRLHNVRKRVAIDETPDYVIHAARDMYAHLFYYREEGKPRHYQKGGLVKLVDEKEPREVKGCHIGNGGVDLA